MERLDVVHFVIQGVLTVRRRSFWNTGCTEMIWLMGTHVMLDRAVFT